MEERDEHAPRLPIGLVRSIAGRLSWVAAVALMLAALLAPALWNGFPIVFYDTGGYIERVFDRTLGFGRSAFYGLFLAAGAPLQFWPNIILQSALMIWMVSLTLRLYGAGGRPWLTASLVVTLCAVTGLPWYSAQLMPDILVPAVVLALALLTLHGDGLRRFERIALAAVVAIGIPSHMSIAALSLALLSAIVVLRPFAKGWPKPDLKWPALAVALGLLLAPLSNLVITRSFAFTPGGFNFVFGRLVQDGVADHYLADRCPDTTIRLCAYRGRLPKKADDWLWAPESPLVELGGFEGFEQEAKRIVIESLTTYPWLHLRTAVWATIQQFASITTGDGIVPWAWHTQWIFERLAPNALPSYLASRQATAPIDFGPLNQVHLPVQALAISVLPAIAIMLRRQRIAALATFLFVALWLNAGIGGVLANPHDRYQSRLAWLAPLAIALAALNRRKG